MSRLSATAIAASSSARRTTISTRKVTSVIASDDPGDPLPGDAAVVVELGGAAGDARGQVGFFGELARRRRLSRLLSLIEPGVLKL